MKVRVLFGRMAGELVEYEVHDARRLLAEGRAVLPDVSVAPPPPVVATDTTAAGPIPRTLPGVLLRPKPK